MHEIHCIAICIVIPIITIGTIVRIVVVTQAHLNLLDKAVMITYSTNFTKLRPAGLKDWSIAARDLQRPWRSAWRVVACELFLVVSVPGIVLILVGHLQHQK